MALRTISTVLIVITAILFAQMALADPFATTVEKINDSHDATIDGEDKNQDISDMIDAWFNMGFIAIFGIMGWGIYRIVRRELTRGRQP